MGLGMRLMAAYVHYTNTSSVALVYSVEVLYACIHVNGSCMHTSNIRSNEGGIKWTEGRGSSNALPDLHILKPDQTYNALCHGTPPTPPDTVHMYNIQWAQCRMQEHVFTHVLQVTAGRAHSSSIN